jgi:heptosyltransferase-2
MSEPKRLLVRAPNWLGDTVMATAAVRVLRRCYPNAHLTVLAPPAFAPFWSAFEGVQGVRSIDRKGAHRGWGGLWSLANGLRREDYDASVLLTESFSSAFLFAAAGIPSRLGYTAQGRSFLLKPAVQNPCPRLRHYVVETLDLLFRGWGLPAFKNPVALEFPDTPKSRQEADRLLGRKGNRPWVAFVPGATYGPTKRWPVGDWRALQALILKNTNSSIVMLGSAAEAMMLGPLAPKSLQKKKRVVMAVGKTDVLGLGGVLRRCHVAVANDTGPLHVAAAVGTPVVGLYGSTSPVWTRPLGKGHKVLYHRVPCSPCYLKECPIDLRCLTGISVAEVWKTVRPLLTGSPKRVKPEALTPETPCSKI